ncbi:HEAT repeat domain-containing protein, partial [bacterium]|nr:HEAT repeat domain-containing protein [bacterium]
WRQKDSKELQPRFDEIFNSSKSPPALKAMALRTAKRLEIPGFSESCERFLKDSNVPLVTAALEYLGRFEPDKIFPILGKFLQAPDPWLKSAALRLIQQYDPSQAISALSAMLLGKNPRHFAPALACTVYFDFSLVRGIISDFLATNPDRNLLESGLCLFQANPDPENLFALFQIEEKLPCESAQSVKLVRRQCEAFLVSAGLLKPGQSEKHQEEFTQRSAQKKAKKSATPAPYSVAGLKTARIEPGRKFLSGVTSEFMVQSGVVCLSLFGLGLLFWFVAFSSSETSNKGSHSRKALSTVANVIKGQVTEKNGDDIVIISQEGEKYILISDSGWSADLQPGNLVLAEVIPYRSSFDGAIIANPKSIKILEESR